MIKQTLVIFSAILLLVSCGTEAAKPAKNNITIKGKVQFDDPQFKMEIYQRDGFDKKQIAEFDINPDGTYLYEMKVSEPGLYTLECKKWQDVQFWAENEDLEINFRGKDTARMPIKNPPYVHINGAGPLNEVMNMFNHHNYLNYQRLIAANNVAYNFTIERKMSIDEMMLLFNDFSTHLSRYSNDELVFLANNYAERGSVIAMLDYLQHNKQNGTVIENIISKLEARNPNYAPLVKYKRERDFAKQQGLRMEIGQPAPEFSFPTPEGDKTMGVKDFKGKLLVLDFWASWCGPCRSEIPHMKELYAKYKDKGVDILSVSIDKKDADWKKALEEEQMPWAQVCTPDAGKEIMKEYIFSGIPYILLLDKEGNILAKGLRGEEIDKEIEKILNK